MDQAKVEKIKEMYRKFFKAKKRYQQQRKQEAMMQAYEYLKNEEWDKLAKFLIEVLLESRAYSQYFSHDFAALAVPLVFDVKDEDYKMYLIGRIADILYDYAEKLDEE